MRRPARSQCRGRAALALALLALAGCELAPRGPLDGLAAAEPLPEPAPGSSWLALGLRLLDEGRPEQAGDAFIRSLRVEGMSAAALTGAGVAARDQGLLTEAKRYFERARDLDPGSVAAYNNLGAVLYGLGELHAARHAFRTAFALSGGASREAARNLGVADLAIARAEAAEPASPPNSRGLRRTGSAEYRLMAATGTAESG